MSAPVEYTCPLIDEVIEEIEKVTCMVTADNRYTSVDVRELMDAAQELDESEVLNKLEEIRTANEELRVWGERMEADLAAEEERVSDLAEELEEARKEISGLEKELEEANNFIIG